MAHPCPSCPTPAPLSILPPGSQVADQLEQALKASKSAEAGKVLPPAAAQVQPLVEAFFVLADVRHKLRPAEEAESAGRWASGAGARVGQRLGVHCSMGATAAGIRRASLLVSPNHLSAFKPCPPLQALCQWRRAVCLHVSGRGGLARRLPGLCLSDERHAGRRRRRRAHGREPAAVHAVCGPAQVGLEWGWLALVGSRMCVLLGGAHATLLRRRRAEPHLSRGIPVCPCLATP